MDTHPIHFHLYDVQVLNRVTWDNIIIPPDPTELGWKDTVRMSPLAGHDRRPAADHPGGAVRGARTHPAAEPDDADRLDTTMFNNIDPRATRPTPIINQLVNFGWEYVYHCHILSHEEMDMMRPVSLALPPMKPDGLTSSPAGERQEPADRR